MLTIRRAEASDADALGRCLDAAYAKYAERIDGLPEMSADCAGEIERFQVWVAETEGAIVGALLLAPCDGFLRLANVAVHPGQRGTGLGRRLMELAESEARRAGFGEMRLNTHADMAETVALCARNGWTESGRQGKTVSMKKALAG